MTTTAPQALELLNNEVVLDWARSFAGRVLNDRGLPPEAQIERAWKLAYARPPRAEEVQSALKFLDREMPILAERMANHDPPPLPDHPAEGVDPVRAAAMVDLCHMLLNSSEFVYVN
jgi:hypothetical protein